MPVKTELEISNENVELIKKTVAVGATDSELNLFLYQAKRSGLDPLARQIYFIKRRVWNKDKKGYDEKATIQSSIDGFRVVAERSGQYAGQDEPEFSKEDDQLVCKVKVYKWHGDQRYQAAVGVAYFDEYAQTKEDYNTKKVEVTGMWKKMPHVMLAKVAEALALRKAFPQDLSGLYTSEEMDQDTPVLETKNDAGESVAKNTKQIIAPENGEVIRENKAGGTRVATSGQLETIYTEMAKKGYDKAKVDKWIMSTFKLFDISVLSFEEAQKVVNKLLPNG